MGIATGKKVAALLNIGVAAIIFSQQISFYIIASRWEKNVSAGIWGAVLMISAALLALQEKRKAPIWMTRLITGLAAASGLIIIGIFSNVVNSYVRFSAKTGKYCFNPMTLVGGPIPEVHFFSCDLLISAALFVASGALGVMSNIYLLWNSYKSVDDKQESIDEKKESINMPMACK